MIYTPLESKTSTEKRIQTQQEMMEQRFMKLNKDLSILLSRSGIKGVQSSQKNLDQIMSLLNKKIQQYNFSDTMIGQNHYKLVQKGMDAPSLERKLQEQRILAEKELSETNNLEKSIFWIDIEFSNQGIDTYLESNQNYLMYKAVDTMRAEHSQKQSFASRLAQKKAQIKGGQYNSVNFQSLQSNCNAAIQRIESEGQVSLEPYLKALKQFEIGNYSKYADYLAKNSRDYKELWQLLEKIVIIQEQKRSRYQDQSMASSALQRIFNTGVQYLESLYKKNSKLKKQNFESIYKTYNIDNIRCYEDESIPLWQQFYQFFRAGDYKSLILRFNQYDDIPSVQEFAKDFKTWIDNGGKKIQQIGTKMRPNWDAFRYQIYLVMMKDPQCVDEVFIEELDDCLWMNLKCCQLFTSTQENNSEDNGDIEEAFLQDRSVINSFAGEAKSFYSSLVFNQEEQQDKSFSWIDFTQLIDLRKMLYESFQDSSEAFTPQRVLIIQLLTLDFIGFTQTLRSLEKSLISQHEFIHFLILISKFGLLRMSAEMQSKFEENAQDLRKKYLELEEYIENQIALYSKDRFDFYPEASLTCIESLPISRERQLQKYSEILVASNQGVYTLFNLKDSTNLGKISKGFEQAMFQVTNKLKNNSQRDVIILAKFVSESLIKKQGKIYLALEVLDSVGGYEDLGSTLKEQFRIECQVYETQGMKNSLRNQQEHQQNAEYLERYAEKYYSKRSKIVYAEEWKQKSDTHIIQFFRLFKKIKVLFSNGEYNITNILQDMQDQHYISSTFRETASSEFYETLCTNSSLSTSPSAQQSSYFEFLYLVYLSCKKFYSNLKIQGVPNQKVDDIEKAKKIYKSILSYSNQFVDKYKSGIDKDFSKHLIEARHQAQIASQI